jgi:uncharacterized repeat protein (TIGR01451 family)
MIKQTISLILCLAGLSLSVVFGFQSDNSTLTRSFNSAAALTNLQITVTVNFTNWGTGKCRGFYYTDQVPSGLTVSTVNVTLNGRAVSDYLFETGQNGDVYPGCTPYRWVLEQPTNFAENNPIPIGMPVQIVYTITSPVSNIFYLQQFNNVGFDPVLTNASFGYSETTNQQVVIFTTGTLCVSVQSATNGLILGLNGIPGTNYVLEASTNLYTWVPLVTNKAPFQFTDTNQASWPRRFYCGKLF